jgi:integrase
MARSRITHINGMLERIRNNPKILKENKQAVEELLFFMQANSANQNTIAKHIYSFEKFMDALDSNVEIKKATRQDLEKAMARIESLKLGEETKRNIRVVVKSYFKHFLGEDLYYPRQIAWLRTSIRKNRKMLPDDILKEDDIIKLIEAANNPRDKAIIALLFDAGIRAGELLSLRRKDADLEGTPAHITVTGKTGPRKIPILFSVPYLARLLDINNGLKPNDSLWMSIGSWSNLDSPLDYSGLRMMIKRLTAKAKINKRIYPHLFRHSRASYYANMLTEQQLKAFFGWTGDSKMTATYVHLSGRDIDNAVLQANGMKSKEEAHEHKLKVIICPKCRYENGFSSRHCSRCGSALDIAIAIKQEEMEEKARALAAKSFEQPETSKGVMDKIKRRRNAK